MLEKIWQDEKVKAEIVKLNNDYIYLSFLKKDIWQVLQPLAIVSPRWNS